MKRFTSVVATVVGAAALFALTPGAAHAQSVTAPYYKAGPYSITVNTSAKVVQSGRAIEWRLKIRCGKGENFFLQARVSQAPTAIPAQYAQWSAYDMQAVGERKGVCTGKTQKFTLPLVVGKTTMVSAAGVVKEIALPMKTEKAAKLAWANVSSSGMDTDRGDPFYCSFIPSETEDGTSCEDATLIGPTLKLR